jgi:hypothetical protein
MGGLCTFLFGFFVAIPAVILSVPVHLFLKSQSISILVVAAISPLFLYVPMVRNSNFDMSALPGLFIAYSLFIGYAAVLSFLVRKIVRGTEIPASTGV